MSVFPVFSLNYSASSFVESGEDEAGCLKVGEQWRGSEVALTERKKSS